MWHKSCISYMKRGTCATLLELLLGGLFSTLCHDLRVMLYKEILKKRKDNWIDLGVNLSDIRVYFGVHF